MTKISKIEYEQTLYIFDYFLSRSFGQNDDGNYMNPSVCLSLIYDEGIDLCADWGEKFPGRKPDPNHNLAQNRLRKFLNQMVEDGWLERNIRGNQIEYLGEGGTWSYAYRLPQALINGFKKEKFTVEGEASRYTGYKG